MDEREVRGITIEAEGLDEGMRVGNARERIGAGLPDVSDDAFGAGKDELSGRTFEVVIVTRPGSAPKDERSPP